jgi:hypothetical protein
LELSEIPKVWKAQILEAKSLGAVLINSHSGKDSWSQGESENFFAAAIEYEKELGIPICHETHRGRILYSPWVAREIIPKFPQLKLNADLSHWVNVAETNVSNLKSD